MDRVSQACDNYDLKIKTKKDLGCVQPAPGMPLNEKLKDKQWSGTNTIRSHILPSKQKGKQLNT